jgi:hypothetical protein
VRARRREGQFIVKSSGVAADPVDFVNLAFAQFAVFGKLGQIRKQFLSS